MEGFLLKWVNFMYGWRRRYFIMHNGVLYYCTDRGQKSKGVIHLNIAQVMAHPKNAKRLIIDTGCTVVHLKAESPEECKQWLSALREEQNSLALVKDAKELRDDDYAMTSGTTEMQTLTYKAGALWNLQAELEAQMDLLIPLLRNNPQLQAVCDLSVQLKNSVADILTMVEEEVIRVQKLTSALEERENLLKIGFTEVAEIERRSAPTFGGQMTRLDEEYEFKDAISHLSDDMFYDAREDFSAFNEPTSLKPSRKCLPVLRNPNQKINLWKILKETIGQELSKIAVPVYFNEPISFLQRFSEDFTHSQLLVEAAGKEDPCLRLAYVACWIVSQYSFTAGRTMKPFNPVLGETFELERDGLRIISEQVSHHPPVSALHCEHEKFVSWGNTEVRSSFKGTYLLVSPTGEMHLSFPDWNEHISWTKPQTSVHNMIIGKVYVDHHGLLKLVNHTTGEMCTLHMKKIGWFDKNPHQIEATVFNSTGIVRFSVRGKWDQKLIIKDETSGTESVVWEMPGYLEGYENNYFFTEFALQLNIPPEAYTEAICPSDSRYRPDQRALENGDVKVATQEKLRIEEKQRLARRVRAERKEEYTPRWFAQVDGEWRYKGEYWEAKANGVFEDYADIF